MTGFAFAHGSAAEMTSPASMPAHLLAEDKPYAPDTGTAGDTALRSAIVKVARYYLRMARTRTPAEMETLIWRAVSADGADHGPSCAAFASLTLALGAKAAGQQSWATGGGSYPWPLQRWADVRVEPNPASLVVTSMLQDAQARHRWHPLGDGYRPQPGDWVLFDGHVEVVIRASAASVSTIGADSRPDLTVNAHKFPAPFGAAGVLGFVDNGDLASGSGHDRAAGPSSPAGSSLQAGSSSQAGPSSQAGEEAAQVPGVVAPAAEEDGWAVVPGAAGAGSASTGSASTGVAGNGVAGHGAAAGAGAHASAYRRYNPPAGAVPGTAAQQAFISMVAPGAIAAQQRYGIPAAVTIAQAIDESGWGQSELATAGHNLFGIKGAGPAGQELLPTQEYENGAWVTRSAAFRAYHNIAESIEDHSRLLATNPAYQHAMASRGLPDAFAAALTGVYATDPGYGSHLIALMRLYHLYQYDAAASSPASAPASGPAAAAPPPAPAAAAPAASRQAQVPGLAVTPGRGGGPAAPDSIPGAAAAALAVGATRTKPRRLRTEPPRTEHGRAAEGRAQRPRREPLRREPSRAEHWRPAEGGPRPRITPRGPLPGTRRYVPQIPHTVTASFVGTAKWPLTRAQPLYQDIASRTGIGWEVLAACDWMQCQAQARYSPVHGEKLGTVNPDGTVFRTRSAALAQCARDLAELAYAVYLIDLARARPLSVRELAAVFAAFRWGGLLAAHDISAMEFPYAVAGLTAQHLKMRWPDLDDPDVPDKPGARFRPPFGAVPIVLSLGYRATA